MTDAASTLDSRATPARPASDSREAAFWDKVARKYAASPIKDTAAYERTLERTRAYLDGNDHVLEVGSGTGTTALKLYDSVGRYVATDVSEEMLTIGREKAAADGITNVGFEQLALPAEGIAGRDLDAILAFNVLHLVTDLPATLKSLGAGLKPGGLLISKTACLCEQTRLWAIPLAIMRALGKAPYVNMLTNAALENTIRDSGFEILETGLYPAPRSRFVVAKKL